MMPVFIKSKPKLAARRLGLQVSPRALLQKYCDNERGIAAIEFAIIAPIMFAVCGQANQKLKIEYRVDVGHQLKGTLD